MRRSSGVQQIIFRLPPHGTPYAMSRNIPTFRPSHANCRRSLQTKDCRSTELHR